MWRLGWLVTSEEAVTVRTLEVRSREEKKPYATEVDLHSDSILEISATIPAPSSAMTKTRLGRCNCGVLDRAGRLHRFADQSPMVLQEHISE
jgi:hypothetical protein